MVFKDDAGVETTVIDVHAHMVPAGVVDAARRKTSWHGVDVWLNDEGKVQWENEGRKLTLSWENPGAGFDERLVEMDAQDVDKQLLSHSPLLWWHEMEASAARDMAQEVNETIAGVCRTWPDRFGGLAYLPLQTPQAAAEELRRAVKELGHVGAAIGTNIGGKNWDDPELFCVLEAAAELDALLFIHPSAGRFPPTAAPYHLRNLIGNPLETTVAIASMIFSGVFDRLPGLKVVLAHGGGYTCMGVGRFDHGARVRKECEGIAALPSDYAKAIYYDSLTHSHGALRFLIDSVGLSQVVLGTDYPADMEQSYPVQWLREAPLSDDERHAIAGRTLRDILHEM